MQWVCNIALFMMLSGIILELISDTKYYKFARWVSGVILLVQFLKPVTGVQDMGGWLISRFASFDYALGTDRVLEEIYGVDEQAEYSVLSKYKERIAEQISRMLQKNGLTLVQTDISVEEDGSMSRMLIWAEYQDGNESVAVRIPTVAPVRVGEEENTEMVSPLELYIRETLAEFYQMEENSIEVVIQEAE